MGARTLHPLALAITAHPVAAFRALGLSPDPWQREVMAATLRGEDVLVLASRQAGKSTVSAAIALHTALATRGTVLLIAPTERQSSELAKRVRDIAQASHLEAEAEGRTYLELAGGGRVIALPASPEGIRGYSAHLVVLDEAAYVPDDLYVAARPMLAVTHGRVLAITTPSAQRGWFYREWTSGEGWRKVRVTATDIPRYSKEFLERERQALGELEFRREYLVEWVDYSRAAFRREWIRVAAPPPLEALRVYQGVDLAISTREDADYTAVVTIGRDKEGRVWVLDVVRARATFHQVLQLVQSQASRWGPVSIAIEAVQYQAAVVQELLRTTSLPVVAVRPDRDKLTRALPLIARYEQGLVWHAPSLPREFEDELLSFPEGEHDDQVDALVYAFIAEGMAVGLSPEDQRRYAAL